MEISALIIGIIGLCATIGFGIVTLRINHSLVTQKTLIKADFREILKRILGTNDEKGQKRLGIELDKMLEKYRLFLRPQLYCALGNLIQSGEGIFGVHNQNLHSIIFGLLENDGIWK